MNELKFGGCPSCGKSDCIARECARVARLESVPADCDVRKILLDVVPGDGDGYELYAKSVSDVEAKLGEIGSRLEEWEMGIRRLPAAPEAKQDAVAAHWKVGPLTEELIDAACDYMSAVGSYEAARCTQPDQLQCTATAMIAAGRALSDAILQARTAAPTEATTPQPASSVVATDMTKQADAHLRALFRYTEGFYGAAIKHGMKAGETANAIAHIERASKALHQIAHAQAAMLATPQPTPVPEPLTDSYVQRVPDKCDRIVWRNNYYHLPLAPTEATHTQPASEPVAWLYKTHAGDAQAFTNEPPPRLKELCQPLYATPQPAAKPAQAEPDYDALEREHMGDYEKKTGIYALQADPDPTPDRPIAATVQPATARDRWFYEQGRLTEATHTQPASEPDPLEKLTRENERLGLYDDMQPTRLSNEQIDAIFNENHSPQDEPWTNWRRFARAIEAAVITAQEPTE